MTSREKLLRLRHDFYNNDPLDYDSASYFTSIEKDLDDFEKYERALEIIAQKINPSVIIVQDDHYALCVPHPSPYHNSFYRYLSEEEGKLLFELFGGTKYGSE